MTTTSRKRLRELAGDARYISGIYNYCDYWCARCLFTARCLNYAMEAERAKEAPLRDLEDASFGDELIDSLSDALELLKEMAAEAGVELDPEDADDALAADTAMEEEERKFQRVIEHPLAVKSEAYHVMIDRWFEAADPAFQLKEDALNTWIRIGLDEDGPAGEANALADAVAVIRWYQFFISLKLHSAILDAQGEAHPLLADAPRPAEGSAKVALIAIDRSMDAWDTLVHLFPQHEGETLEILIYLDRLRRAVEVEFPAARAFARPGFDDSEVWA